MNWDLLPISISSLAVAAIVCILAAFKIARRRGRWLNFPSLLLVNYALSLPISGIVHLSGLSGDSRGYFDALSSPSSSSIGSSTLAVALGSIVLIGAISLDDRKFPPVPFDEPENTRGETATLGLAGLLLLPGGLIATAQLSAYAASTDSTRIIALSDGMARVSYFSNWLCWGLVFISMVALSAGRIKRSAVGTSVVIGISTVAIVSILSWTGGRSVILVFTLPLIATYWNRLRKAAWLITPAALICGFIYIMGLTVERFSNKSSSISNVWTWLDWEWGRFSMVVFAAKYSDEYGNLDGETFLQGIANVALGALRLIGLQVTNPSLRSSMEVAGANLLDSKDIYIVPGLVSELMMNFGLSGVLIGLALLGWAASWVDRRFVSSKTVSTRLAWAYVGTLIVLRTISADSGTIYSYLLFTGMPILIVACVVSIGKRLDTSLLERTPPGRTNVSHQRTG